MMKIVRINSFILLIITPLTLWVFSSSLQFTDPLDTVWWMTRILFKYTSFECSDYNGLEGGGEHTEISRCNLFHRYKIIVVFINHKWDPLICAWDKYVMYGKNLRWVLEISDIRNILDRLKNIDAFSFLITSMMLYLSSRIFCFMCYLYLLLRLLKQCSIITYLVCVFCHVRIL